MATKEERKVTINRLKSMYPLRAHVDESYKKGIEAAKAGKPTVWSMLAWWEGDVILKAMDLGVVYPENYATVCATQGVAQSYLDRADADGFPTHLCGYSRNTFGYASRMMKELNGEIPPEAPMGGMPKPMLLLGSNVVCDARYKWFQALGNYMDTPVWVLEMPTPGVKELFMEDAYERYVQFIVGELREFIGFLEKMLDRKMDWDRFDETVRLTEQILGLWHGINELRKARPCPMHSRDFWSSMVPGLFLMGDLKETLKGYQALYDEVQERVDNGVSAIMGEEKYRLMFSELPPWHTLKIFDQLAERGWNFVIESWTYHPPVPIDLTGVSDPVERLARLCFQFNVGYYQDALNDGETYGYHAYPQVAYARDWKVDGAFLHPLVTCRSASTHLPYTRDLLLRTVSVPSIMIEGDIVDLRLFDPVDTLRKAEPFEETMDYYKQVRKERGYEW